MYKERFRSKKKELKFDNILDEQITYILPPFHKTIYQVYHKLLTFLDLPLCLVGYLLKLPVRCYYVANFVPAVKLYEVSRSLDNIY